MKKENPLQFAVVREDPQIEIGIFERYKIQNPIFIGSGGCTALSLACEFPQIPQTLIEPNPAQIQLIKNKVKVLQSGNSRKIRNVFGLSKPNSGKENLIECGNYESLFRCFRQFLFQFVADESFFLKVLMSESKSHIRRLFENPYWPVAFDLFFHDSILTTMFGPAAIQHAPAESYGRYFQKALEKGLMRPDSHRNYFLHHIFFGRYLQNKNSQPLFLRKKIGDFQIRFKKCFALEVEDYSAYDFIGLSNIFDWSSTAEVNQLAKKLRRETRIGTVILFRQLNNKSDFKIFFGDQFQWLNREAQSFHKKDRSLFYSSIQLARKK